MNRLGFLVASMLTLCAALPLALPDAPSAALPDAAAAAATPGTGPDAALGDGSDPLLPLRIVGGAPASDGEYPWMAALYTGVPGLQFCGGSLVRPTVIVTAAHCAVLIQPGVTGALLGRLDLFGTGGEEIPVAAVLVHPLYGPTGVNDIALVKLAFASQQPTLDWATSGQASLYAAGVDATVIGWGLTEDGGDPSDVLLEVEVPIVSDGDCEDAYDGGIDPATELCAGDLANGGEDTCQGDSGGPLLVADADGGDWLLAGITSWGQGCAEADHPGVYAEVGALAGFLGTWVDVLEGP